MYKWNWRQMCAVFFAAAVTAAAAGCNGTVNSVPSENETAVSEKESEKESVKESEKQSETKVTPEDGQYYVPCFYPEDLLKWNVNQGEGTFDLSWCASVIPLAERVNQEILPALHDGKREEAHVMAVSIMNSSTSNNPAQGSLDFMEKANMFSFWQYIDTLIYWGGSSGEGIIVPPGPDVTDAAHKNGVKVLGTVFFPQEVHGGKLDWVRQMTASTDGVFPAADKLAEMAETLGFDGWFINQETEGGTKEDAAAMRDMIAYLKQKDPSLSVVWYDAMVEDGPIDWQNALNDKNKMFLRNADGKTVADSMFLNFWWNTDKLEKEALLEKSEAYAKQQNIDPFELYAGIDVQSEGVNTPVKWNLFLKQDGSPYTSLGLYCPSWTYYSAEGDASQFQKKEELLWVNAQGNPALKAENTGEWPGISTFKKEQSVVKGTPFVTDFSMGHGLAWYSDGEKVSDQEWNNRSLQDIMPSYRFSLKGEIENQAGAVDYEEAWNGGSCIRFSGNMKAEKTAEAELFAAGFQPEQDTFASTVMKSTIPLSISLHLEFTDGGDTVIQGDKPVGKEWSETRYDLSGLEEKTVRKISLLMTAEEEGDAVIKLGHFDLLSGTENKTVIPTVQTEVKGIYSLDGIHAGIRVGLGEVNESISRYEIYEKQGNDIVLVKAAANPNTYIDGITRNGKETETAFTVMTVDQRGERSEAGSFTMKWGPYPKPSADFTLDKTLVKPGEEIQLKSLASETAEEFSWKLDGAVTKESREENPIIVYDTEGTYTISMTAKNSSGEDTAVKEEIVVVRSDADQISEAAKGKRVEVSSFANEKEDGIYAVDGDIKTKWCAVGEEPHTITIDLGNTYLISAVQISNAQAGGEGSEYNTRGYTIFAGMEQDSLKEAAVVTDNTEAVSRTPVAPVKAKYVSISIDKATQGGDTATRIFDIKIYGIPE